MQVRQKKMEKQFPRNNMYKHGRTIAFILQDIAPVAFFAAILMGVFLSCSMGSYDIRITNEEINTRLAAKFPLTRTYLLLFKVTLSNPHVILHDATDKVTLGIDVAVEMPSRKKRDAVSGAVTVTSGIQFNNKTGQFFLKDPVIDSLSVPEVENGRALEIKELISAALHEYLVRMPVYTLKATEVKKSIARLVIKDVRISNGVIIVTLGG